jgi:hypothetical protein
MISRIIEICKTSDLSTEAQNQITEFINNEFGHIAIVKQTEWAKPDWTILYLMDNKIASFCNIVERDILIDSKIVKIAGINNVITSPLFRGNGLSTLLLSETENFIFHKLKREIGLLLCADNLIQFYEKLSWYKVECPVFFSQNEGLKRWAANTMLLSLNKKIDPKEINLNGLPW